MSFKQRIGREAMTMTARLLWLGVITAAPLMSDWAVRPGKSRCSVISTRHRGDDTVGFPR